MVGSLIMKGMQLPTRTNHKQCCLFYTDENYMSLYESDVANSEDRLLIRIQSRRGVSSFKIH